MENEKRGPWVVYRNDTFLGLAKDKKSGASAFMWSTHPEDMHKFREYSDAAHHAKIHSAGVYPVSDRPETSHERLARQVANQQRQESRVMGKKDANEAPARRGAAPKAEIFGHSASRVGKWFGANGYTVEQFKIALEEAGVLDELTPSAISTSVSDGRNPKYATNLPELSKQTITVINKQVGPPAYEAEKAAKAKEKADREKIKKAGAAATSAPAKATAKATAAAVKTAVVSKRTREVVERQAATKKAAVKKKA